jgi:hypothetical protein
VFDKTVGAGRVPARRTVTCELDFNESMRAGTSPAPTFCQKSFLGENVYDPRHVAGFAEADDEVGEADSDARRVLNEAG